jgi:uncharacterized protein with von Willebrand factor type A (vWA) domain
MVLKVCLKKMMLLRESFVTDLKPLSQVQNARDSSGGLLSRLNNQFGYLDLLPESLTPAIITHSSGELDTRCQSFAQLRQGLLAGTELASPCPWLPSEVQQRVLERIEQSGIARYCKDNEEVTDALILDLLDALERKQGIQRALALQHAEDQKQQQLLALQQELDALSKNKQKRQTAVLTQEQLNEIQAHGEISAWLEVLAGSGGFFPQVWDERVLVWQQLESVFTDLGVITGLGWDLSRGVLQSHGWLNLMRLHKLVEQLPQLREVIETLGRMKDTDGEPIIEEIVSHMSVMARHQQEVTTPLVPMETKGITRSDSISRMLPQEAAFLGHPVLKKLWHARRAEHALLSYAVEGTEIVQLLGEQEQEVREERAGTNANKHLGPMIVCLDTSASMKGTPENIAKALVLECLSVAKKEKRECYVYLFGSRGEVEEMELTPTEKGLERMILFLSMSFGGGTDAESPLLLALEKSEQEQWQKSDILIISDGEFPVSSDLVKKIATAKEQRALSVHGTLIGNVDRVMSRICDPLHRFDRWIDLQLNKRSHSL